MDINAESNRIKGLLNACETEADIHLVADQERDNVLALAESPEGKIQAIQISNLKAYLLKDF